jgi:hypothetical protein
LCVHPPDPPLWRGKGGVGQEAGRPGPEGGRRRLF